MGIFLLFWKWQTVITEKYGSIGCNVGEDGGFAPDISRQDYFGFPA